MTKEVKETLNILSEVMDIDFFSIDDLIRNNGCGIGKLFDNIEECQKACDKWNKYANIMGWEKYSVYEDDNNEECTFYVCSNGTDAENFGYTMV